MNSTITLNLQINPTQLNVTYFDKTDAKTKYKYTYIDVNSDLNLYSMIFDILFFFLQGLVPYFTFHRSFVLYVLFNWKLSTE